MLITQVELPSLYSTALISLFFPHYLLQCSYFRLQVSVIESPYEAAGVATGISTLRGHKQAASSAMSLTAALFKADEDVHNPLFSADNPYFKKKNDVMSFKARNVKLENSGKDPPEPKSLGSGSAHQLHLRA